MAVSSLKLTSLLAGAAALIAGLPTVQKATSSSQAAPAATAAVTTAPVAQLVSTLAHPTRFGINLTNLGNGERSFMNLMAGVHYQSPDLGWADAPYAWFDKDGNVIAMPSSMSVVGGLMMPPKARTQDVSVTCRWTGKAHINMYGGDAQVLNGTSGLTFLWRKGATVSMWINQIDASAPLKDIDCRETGADRTALFDPDFLNALRPYDTVRFLDWQKANDNTGGNWANMPSPLSNGQRGLEGVSVENMVALANAAHVNPYFTMPYNADATYTRNFAQYVRDHLDKSLVAYVEISNEVWNWGFNSAQQSLAQGLQMKLDADGNRARMYYYATKIIANMTIWEQVYANDKPRLVRIAAGQAYWPELLQMAMEYKDTASHVDAIAMAPYFAYDTFSNVTWDATNIDLDFQKISQAVDNSIGAMKADKIFANNWKKRLICYEAGQSIMYGDQGIVRKLETDPRMADMYRKYMRAWDSNASDLMVQFASISPMGANAWGLAEYSGQPMSETPKRQAVLEMIAQIGSR